MTKRWRQLTVWLHVLSSVSWMAQAMTLCVLLSVGLAATDPATRDAATAMALAADHRLLAPMANLSALTGIVLGLATPWGLLRHWWVLVKFGITIVQLNVGIWLLSPNLNAALTDGPSLGNVLGGVLMATAIAFQGWLSVAKPWGRRRPRGTTGPAWIFVATVLAGLADLTLALVIGSPMPLASLVTLIVVIATRGRRPAPEPIQSVA